MLLLCSVATHQTNFKKLFLEAEPWDFSCIAYLSSMLFLTIFGEVMFHLIKINWQCVFIFIKFAHGTDFWNFFFGLYMYMKSFSFDWKRCNTSKGFDALLFIVFARKMIPFFRFSLKLRSFLSLFFFRLSIMCRRIFNKTIILLGLAGYEMIITNSALRASLVIYHFISSALS